MAAKIGGGDPSGNPRLRLAIDTARANSMPKENIERAIKKGTGELEGVEYHEVTYEGYGPAGVALLIEAVTDNPTRTVAEVRSKMTRLGGNLGTPNSVAWMFEKKGQIYVDAATIEEDSLMEAALDAGAEDVVREDERFLVTTGPAEFHSVQEALKAKHVGVGEAELAMVPKSTVQVGGKDADSLLKLLETLEDLDDVQKVWANFDMDVAEMAR
jgi:YebC/PmpR family DNA-binding regulatory protein